MAVDGKVVYEVDYDIDKANKSLSTLSKDLKETGDKMAGVGDAMSTRVTAPVIAGATAAIAGFMKLSTELDNVKKSAIAVGAGVEGLQALQFAGRKAGVETDKMTDTLKKVQELATSNSEGFKALRLNLKDANGEMRDTDDIFYNLLRTVDLMPTGKRMEVLMGLGFTEELTTFNQLLDENSGFIDNYREGLKNAVAEEDIQQFEEFNDSLENIKNQLIPIAAQLGTAVLPHFQEFADWFSSDGVDAIENGLPKLVQFVEDYGVAIGVIAAAGPILSGTGRILSGIGTISSVATPAVAKLGTALGPIGLLIATVILGFNELEEGWKSLGDVSSNSSELITMAFDDVDDSFGDFVINMGKQADDLFTVMYTPLNAIIDTINAIANGIAELFNQDVYNIPNLRLEAESEMNKRFQSSDSSRYTSSYGQLSGSGYGSGNVNVGAVTINAKTDMSTGNVQRFTDDVMEQWAQEMQLRKIVD